MIKLNKKTNRWYKKTEAHGWIRISNAEALDIDLVDVGKAIDGGGEIIFILWS